MTVFLFPIRLVHFRNRNVNNAKPVPAPWPHLQNIAGSGKEPVLSFSQAKLSGCIGWASEVRKRTSV